MTMTSIHESSEPASLIIAEDDELRSQHMRRLIQEDYVYTHYYAHAELPRILVQFWDNAKAIPADVLECIDSWQPLEEVGFERLLFDDSSAKQFIADHFDPRYAAAFERCGHPAMRSDYFRLCFIAIKGGFYVDADDVYRGGNCEHWFLENGLKLQPLCYDIKTDSMVERADYIRNTASSSDLIFYVNNNPLIAPSGHPVILMALERSTQILLDQAGEIRDIQATTGPGNLTACLVRHAIESEHVSRDRDFLLIADWDTVAVSQWPLEYRSDDRNWRLWARRNV
jgi:hypothetical protein